MESCAVAGPKPTRFKFGYKEIIHCAGKSKRLCYSSFGDYIVKRVFNDFISVVPLVSIFGLLLVSVKSRLRWPIVYYMPLLSQYKKRRL